MEKEYLTITEAAEIVGVHRNTIGNALRSGKLKGYKLNNEGKWRIKRTDFEAYLKEQNTEPES